jgi:UDP-glucose 4-epimerase
MPTSLVTGGAGFIGSHLVDFLLDRGDSVRVLDDFSTGKAENILQTRDNIELIQADLRDPDAVRRAVQGVDLIFHHAAFISVPQSMEEPQNCLDINVNGTALLLNEARSAGVERVVIASSAAVYGENTAVPLQETEIPSPLSPYAVSKEINELYAKLFTHQLGLDVVALRYFNVYGPRQNPESDYAAVIPIFTSTLIQEDEPVIFGDGKQSRDFIFIDDVVRANILASEAARAPGEVINICSGQEINLLELLDTLSLTFNREIAPVFKETRAGDIYRSLGNPGKADKLLGFSSQVPIQQGITAVADWMRSQV